MTEPEAGRRAAHPEAIPASDPAPVVILVRPQLGENIGMCARAMMNFGLHELRLVAPRDGWPSEGANSAASGAVAVLKSARLFDTVEDAIADLHRVYATTARDRGQLKTILTADGAAAEMSGLVATGSRVGILFGPERVGLDNDDVALADVVVSFPVHPAFTSVNLAQAVLLVGYEWWKRASGDTPPPPAEHRRSPPAEREHIVAFFDMLEAELDEARFFFPPAKRPIMVRNLRNIFHRLEMSRQDVQTLRGVVQALLSGRRGRREPAASVPEGEQR